MKKKKYSTIKNISTINKYFIITLIIENSKKQTRAKKSANRDIPSGNLT